MECQRHMECAQPSLCQRDARFGADATLQTAENHFASPPTNSRRGRSVGQGLVEYALVLALIGVLAIGATQYLGGQVSSAFASVGDQLSGLVTVDSGPQPTAAPTPDPPASYTKRKTCQAAGYTWVTKPKPAHCT